MDTAAAIRVLGDGAVVDRGVVYADSPLPTIAAPAQLHVDEGLVIGTQFSLRYPRDEQAGGGVAPGEPASRNALPGKDSVETAASHEGVRDRATRNVHQMRTNFAVPMSRDEHEERVPKVSGQQQWIDAYQGAYPRSHLPRREADHRHLVLDVEDRPQVAPLQPFIARPPHEQCGVAALRRTGDIEARVGAPTLAHAQPDAVGFEATARTGEQLRPPRHHTRMLETGSLEPIRYRTQQYSSGAPHPEKLFLHAPVNADVLQQDLAQLRREGRVAPEVQRWSDFKQVGRERRMREVCNRVAGKDAELPVEDNRDGRATGVQVVNKGPITDVTQPLVAPADRARVVTTTPLSAAVEVVNTAKSMRQEAIRGVVSDLGAQIREANPLLPAWEPLAF